jgi:hypothetical protein
VPPTLPQSTTTTIGVLEYAIADSVVDTTDRALTLNLSPDVRQCVLVGWIERASRPERDAMLNAMPNPITQNASRRHLAAAYAQCLSPSDVHIAEVSLIVDSRLRNANCVASRLDTYHLAPESVWLGLLVGFPAVSAAANDAFERSLSWCGA